MDMIARNVGDFCRLADAAKIAADSIAPIQTEVQRLSDEIARLEREIVEHRRPLRS